MHRFAFAGLSGKAADMDAFNGLFDNGLLNSFFDDFLSGLFDNFFDRFFNGFLSHDYSLILLAHSHALSDLEDFAFRLDRGRQDDLNIMHFFDITRT